MSGLRPVFFMQPECHFGMLFMYEREVYLADFMSEEKTPRFLKSRNACGLAV